MKLSIKLPLNIPINGDPPCPMRVKSKKEPPAMMPTPKPRNPFRMAVIMTMTLGLTTGFSYTEEGHPIACSFQQGKWISSEWMFVKRRDMAGRSEWLQKANCIENDGHHTSMVYKKKFSGDVTISMTTAFANRMAPALVIVTKLGDADGATVFDEHVEITMWDEGVNIWRLHTVNGKSLWELTAFSKFKLSQNTPYKLEVTKKRKELTIKVDGHAFGYIENSLPDDYYVGITGCEGVNRFYDVAIRTAHGPK